MAALPVRIHKNSKTTGLKRTRRTVFSTASVEKKEQKSVCRVSDSCKGSEKKAG